MLGSDTERSSSRTAACADLIEEMRSAIAVERLSRATALAAYDLAGSGAERAAYQAIADEAEEAISSYEAKISIARQVLFA